MKINDITYGVRGAVFEISRHLDPVFLEEVPERSDKADGVEFARRARRIISGHVGRILSAAVCG